MDELPEFSKTTTTLTLGILTALEQDIITADGALFFLGLMKTDIETIQEAGTMYPEKHGDKNGWEIATEIVLRDINYVLNSISKAKSEVEDTVRTPVVLDYHGHRKADLACPGGSARPQMKLLVHVNYSDGRTEDLPHIVRHSPDGFEWGYEGSGPADLALSILTHAMGREPPQRMYQEFKRMIIARIDRDAEGWLLPRDSVDTFISVWEGGQSQENN